MANKGPKAKPHDDICDALRLVQHKGVGVVVCDVGIPVSQLERVGQRAAVMLDVPPDSMCLNGRVAVEIGVMLAFVGRNHGRHPSE